MNSEKLRRYVIEELQFDPRVDASGLGVAVADRIVSLTGHVRSVGDKMAVLAAVRRLKGVRGIVVDIEVRPTADLRMEDEEIAKRAAALLAWLQAVPRDSVKVTVENGFVTLSGMVDWNFQRSAAEEGLRRLAGVTGVRNDITLRRLSQQSDIRQSIKQAMHRLADVESSRISVDVDGEGRVKLKGRVIGWRARNAIEDAAWLVPGVREVDNGVRVG